MVISVRFNHPKKKIMILLLNSSLHALKHPWLDSQTSGRLRLKLQMQKILIFFFCVSYT